MELNDFFKLEKERVIEKCTVCGLCVKRCEVIEKSRLCSEKPKDVHKAVIEFFNIGQVCDVLHERINSA